MNLNEAKSRIQKYLNSIKTYPLIVDIQTKQELADIIDYFKIGDNQFLTVEKFCNQDGALKFDELYAAVSSNSGNTFISELTGFLKLLGENITKNALKTLVTSNISGHVIIFTYQCKNYLKFSDPRISESGRLLIVDGTPDSISEICFISPELEDAFPEAYNGIQKIGYILENCTNENAYIATTADKSIFSESVYHITCLNNGYDILCNKDPRTSIVPRSFGNINQWNYVLQHMGSKGDWSSVIEEHFGPERYLSNAISSYLSFDKQKQWLYYIALSICGSKDNEYLQMAVNHASNSEEFVRSIFRSILTVERGNLKFDDLYIQRKELLRYFCDALSEVIDYCKVLSVEGENAIYYLTDLTKPEKERVISWLDVYGEHYSAKQLSSILSRVYPDLASYLSDYHFKNNLLDSYFKTYKYQKIINKILPSFESLVDEQSTKMDFVKVLKPRSSIVDKLDVNKSRAFFFDALGVEYLGYIQVKCNEYGLSANISCARCDLPSITSCNKEFIAVLNSKGCNISDIKDLDEIKHHGEDSFDYEKEKTPIYLIRELELIDNLLIKIRADVLNGQYDKAIIISDHGASRLAVLHNTENIWSMATKGKHSGRCCKISEIDSKPDFAIEESGFWVLSNYDRFKGGRKANVEVHGGATLEEVTVPIIEITQKQSNIEAFIIDNSRIITLGAKEHAVIRVYVNIKSSNISIRIENQYYDAHSTGNPYVYTVDLPDITKKGIYTIDIVNGSDVIASGQQFEIKKKGMSEVSLFD